MLVLNLILNYVILFLFCDIIGWCKISVIICFVVVFCVFYSSFRVFLYELFLVWWGNECLNCCFNVNLCDMSENLIVGKLLEIIEVVDSCYDWSWLLVNCEISFFKYIGNDKFLW